MSMPAVIGYVTWTLEPDREPDAEPTTYAMECAVCGRASDATEEFTDVQSWALKHCGQEPVSPHLPGADHATLAYVAHG
ncbi:hypothetical protein [Streptomyces sp. NBC_01363]|uniref:DUF7848 domain-containing protein n=1 Tax=Streptomyces sp. NBC_01363 TaxID=2903840 RepID=UPI002251B026|nr:hypothetical protein [Streptomyces sp. NBC_01363]MCX4736171.1 hypothetical protein [Streptomyces sp. NBC_01363]